MEQEPFTFKRGRSIITFCRQRHSNAQRLGSKKKKKCNKNAWQQAML
jgi:hypothetical protein